MDRANQSNFRILETCEPESREKADGSFRRVIWRVELSDYRYGQDVGRTTGNGEASGAINSWKGQKKGGKEAREGKKCFGGARKWSSYGNVTRMTMWARPPPHRSCGLQWLEPVVKAIKEGSTEKKYSSFSLPFWSPARASHCSNPIQSHRTKRPAW